MQLARIRLSHLTPFEDVTLSFVQDDMPRRLTVLFGGDRTGKTTILAAVATTRPGFSVPPPPGRRQGDSAPWVSCDWLLGEDDPERPHLLRVLSPAAQYEDETPEQVAFRRKEQALFDRRAQDRGFALVLVSGARWFSRAANQLSQPDRTVGRYDVRAAPVVEDATRADLTRETKQILSYAAIGAAVERMRVPEVVATRMGLAPQTGEAEEEDLPPIGRLEALHGALESTLAVFLDPFGWRWEGVVPETLEPVFRDHAGRMLPFEELPRGARHLVAIGALVVRALAGAYPEDPHPREREGVALVDDIELGHDTAFIRALPKLLTSALPRVQWVVTTSSPLVTAACAPGETIVLRRSERRVEIHEGELALLH